MTAVPARRLLLLTLALVLVAAVAAVSGSAGGAVRTDDACTWGASSTAAFVEDGALVESAPATSGCVPAG